MGKEYEEGRVSETRVVMLTQPACAMCHYMAQLLGERVEAVDVIQHPEMLDLTEYTSLPIFLVYRGEQHIGSFYGMMPKAAWDRHVARYNVGGAE